MKSKKLLCKISLIFLAVLLFACMVAVIAVGASGDSSDNYDAIFSIGNITVQPDDTFKVNLMLTKNSGFSGMDLKLNYDNTKIVPIAYDKKGTGRTPDSIFAATSNLSIKDVVLEDLKEITYMYAQAAEIDTTGKLLGITFKAIGDFEETEISISVSGLVDSAEENLKYNCINGIVSRPVYCDITFDANGGTTSTENKTVLRDSAYGELPTPTRKGYAFDGWYTSLDDGTKVTAETIVTFDGDHTLYAKWNANEYTVTFNANTGIISTSRLTVKYDSPYGELPTPTKTGYDFNGWYTSISGGTKITNETTVTSTVNHTLYARWSASEYTLTFDANGGITPTESKTIKYDSTYGVMPTPTRTGYTFGGWYSELNSATKITSSTKVKVIQNQTVYAKWTANNYLVTFNANGGVCATSTMSVTYDSTYSNLPIPTLSGYTFDWWETENNEKITNGSVVKIAENTVIYAHWTPNQYTVTFDANDGSCDTDSMTVTFDSAYGVLPVPTRSGAEFVGWYTAKMGGTIVKGEDLVKTAGNHTLYARWKKPGDSNGDGIIDVRDAVRVAQYIAGWQVNIVVESADVTGDGAVDIGDAVRLAQYLAGWGVTLG